MQTSRLYRWWVYNTSHPACKKSAIFDIGTKYATCGLPVVAVPQYIFKSRSLRIAVSFSSPRCSCKFRVINSFFCSHVLPAIFLRFPPRSICAVDDDIPRSTCDRFDSTRFRKVISSANAIKSEEANCQHEHIVHHWQMGRSASVTAVAQFVACVALTFDTSVCYTCDNSNVIIWFVRSSTLMLLLIVYFALSFDILPEFSYSSQWKRLKSVETRNISK